MKISIVTATFNAANTLDRTIACLRQQNYPDLEYIVIDGRSKDSTVAILEKNRDFISQWISEKDTGIYNAMNKGLKLVQGDWVGILNADDAYTEGVLHSVSTLALEHPEVDVFYANVRVKHPSGFQYVYQSSKALTPGDFWKTPVCHPTMFVRKSCYQKFGIFDETFRISADYELILRFFLNKAVFFYVDEVWVEMLAGGASDVNLNQGKVELRQAAVKHGVFYGMAKFSYYFEAWKNFGINLLRKVSPVKRN